MGRLVTKQEDYVVKTEDGCDLSVSLFGRCSNGDLPVVMLHSLFFSGRMFNATVKSFAGSRLCIVPDHRGQGNSSLGKLQPTMSQLAADISAILDQLEIPSVHLVGSSMGGYVALEFMRNCSDRVASLTLSCCTGQKEADPNRFDALANTFQYPHKPDLSDKISSIMFGQSFSSSQSKILDYWRQKFGQLSNHTETVVRRVFEHEDFANVLDQIRCPTLLIAGAEDRAKRPEDLKWIQNKIPVIAEYVLIKNAGHTPPVETPQKYASLVNDFIKRAELAKTKQDCV